MYYENIKEATMAVIKAAYLLNDGKHKDITDNLKKIANEVCAELGDTDRREIQNWIYEEFGNR